MVTVAGVKIKAKTKEKVTSITIRENAKRDLSPKWDGTAELSNERYIRAFFDAMKWYRLESSVKELKPKVIDWMGRNSYSKDLISSYKKTKDWRTDLTMGAIAACLLKGMPHSHPGLNDSEDLPTWLDSQINRIIKEGRDDIDTTVVVDKVDTNVNAPNIQDRIREQAVQMSEEIDSAIDSFHLDPDKFDPKAFKMFNLLRGKGAKAAQARYIKGFFAKGLAELQELASGKADEQLREGYSYLSRKNVKKLIEFYESIAAACDQIAAEAKVLKKPRTAKVKPAEQLVSKLKFMLSEPKLAITSVPPVQIIGAQGVVVYNVRTRKLGYYIAKSSAGLGVKGTTLTEFTEKSTQKTLRKPLEQIKEFKEQNTQKRFETWYAKNVKTTETVLNGRINEDIIILKVYK